ncbi:MAG: MarR family transcriptional regulator [Alphaproteobacteria bacterium]|nr:MarR family transcriptional regulator [Alphaproteobacteria bacterium]
MPMTQPSFDHRVAELRRFNRFYTQKIGVLEEGLLDSPFSLTEARVLFELASAKQPTAAQLGKELGIDLGYLSRILRGFERRGLICRTPSPSDRRLGLLSLTASGRSAFAELDLRSQAAIAVLLRDLHDEDQSRLVAAARTIERVLDGRASVGPGYLLRPHRAGDLGWVVSRHGALYAQEYGLNVEFEALVAEIAAKFLRNFKPQREFCWIAETEGENVGSVMLVEDTDAVAKLRLLLVEPHARGHGIGSRLVQECLRFAREARYQRVSLWTNSVLLAARRLYEKSGFRMVDAQPHHSFGQDLVGETWELVLS